MGGGGGIFELLLEVACLKSIPTINALMYKIFYIAAEKFGSPECSMVIPVIKNKQNGYRMAKQPYYTVNKSMRTHIYCTSVQ
jgi:hypothetical protein